MRASVTYIKTLTATMKLSKLLLVAAFAPACFAFAGQDAVTLQRALNENATEIYKVDSKVNQTIDSQLTGEMPMNVTTAMTYKVKSGKVDPAKGTLDVEVTMSVDKLDADGPLGGQLAQQQIKPIVEKGTLDKLGHLTLTPAASSDALSLAMAGAESTQSTMFVEFPDHPVKIGDGWDIKIPKSIFTGAEDQIIRAKLAGEKVLDGHDVWIVSVTGKINMSFDSSKLPPAPGESTSPLGNMTFIFKGSVDVTGEGSVEKSTGKTLLMTSTGNMKSSVEIPDHDLTMQANGTMTSTVKLQPN
jgi:hypothetical protein